MTETGRSNTQLFSIRKPERSIPRSEKLHLRGLSASELQDWVKEKLNAPSYRSSQIFQWIHQRDAQSFDEMSNLSKVDRQKLCESARLDRLQIKEVAQSSDGTAKMQLVTPDGETIESVLIPNEGRGYTQCISSQAGCALNCRFCATASLGFKRNLDTWEIVDQVYRAREWLSARSKEQGDEWTPRITNLVYMGMGEPLHNFNHVRRSIEILKDEAGEAIAGRRITVSTSGLVPAIERFAREGLGDEVGLAISLNATTDEIRNEVMPINNRWNIKALLDAVRLVPTGKRRPVTFEYVLLADVNDTSADAKRLIRLIRDFRCHINLIPFNPHPHAPYRRPETQKVRRFHQMLRDAKIRVYLRTPRGDDIGAACGQLARQQVQPAAKQSV